MKIAILASIQLDLNTKPAPQLAKRRYKLKRNSWCTETLCKSSGPLRSGPGHTAGYEGILKIPKIRFLGPEDPKVGYLIRRNCLTPPTVLPTVGPMDYPLPGFSRKPFARGQARDWYQSTATDAMIFLLVELSRVAPPQHMGVDPCFCLNHLAATSTFAERVNLDDSGTQLTNYYELQPESRPHFRSKRTPVAVGRGAARAEDAQGTPTQSHISPSVLVYQENLNPQAPQVREFDVEASARQATGRDSQMGGSAPGAGVPLQPLTFVW